jgi:hypothetical protein
MRTMYISEPTFPAVRVLGLMVVPTFKNSPHARPAGRPAGGRGVGGGDDALAAFALPSPPAC